MATSEELLQRLLDLKLEEMRRTKTHRIVKFIFVTLPMFIVLVVSIYGAWILMQQGMGLIDQLGGGLDKQLQQLQNIKY